MDDAGPRYDADPSLKQSGRVRTDLYCTECSRNFIAELDYDVDGNHVVECPYCQHEHCRQIANGRVTGERWSSREQRVDVARSRVWKHDVLPIQTSTASAFIRAKWLERLQ